MNVGATGGGLQALLERLGHVEKAHSADARSASPPGGSEAAGFTTVLAQVAGDAVATIRSGEIAATAGVGGGLPVQEVAEAVMVSEQTLQTAIVLRDKVVAAYLDLTRMQI